MKYEATETRKMLDRFEEQNWDRHTTRSYETVEVLTKEVVEGGSLSPDVTITAELNLTIAERLTGNREQDMTGMIGIGILLGTALERDIPTDSEKERAWREGEFIFPDS